MTNNDQTSPMRKGKSINILRKRVAGIRFYIGNEGKRLDLLLAVSTHPVLQGPDQRFPYLIIDGIQIAYEV
jgi:hypothetical protein